MSLHDKYNDVLGLAQQLNVKNGNVVEENGKLKVWGTTQYQMDANRLWEKIKEHPGWENEVVADIKAENSDIHGMYTVVAGDSLSKISKKVYGDANKYQAIFEANKDQLADPDKIKVGQTLRIPNA